MSTADELRKKYLKNPPEGSSKEEIEQMDDEDLLDLEYFMNEVIFDESPLGFILDDLQTMETVKVKCVKCKRTELVPKKALDNLVLDFPNTDVSIPCPYCLDSMLPTNYTDPNGKKYHS